MTAGAHPARRAEQRDIPGLQDLWQLVFRDEQEDIACFFETFFEPELTAVITEGERPLAAAYAIPVGSLVVPGREPVDCAMIYAVATHPDARGRGWGASVTQAAAELAAARGYSAVVLKPADDGLFGFYEKHSVFREFFETYTALWDRPRDGASTPLYSVREVRPGEYRDLRRRFLDGRMYIDMDERALSYQARLSRATGGYLAALYSGAEPVGCAVLERAEETILVKELLLDRGCTIDGAMTALAGAHPAGRYVVRTPQGPLAGAAGPLRFGMLRPVPGLGGTLTPEGVAWYGLAFD